MKTNSYFRSFFALSLAALLLTACGTTSTFKEFQQKGETIYLKGEVKDIQEAIIIAMAEKRLTSPEVVTGENGIVIYSEQSAIVAALFNSYGGFCKATITPSPALGQSVYAVSAVTRSRAVYEPVGNQDALKGWNYNNPLIARKILEQTKELVNAKSNK